MKPKTRSFKKRVQQIQTITLLVFLALFVSTYLFYRSAYTGKIISMNTRIVEQTSQTIRENSRNITDTIASFVSNATVQAYLAEEDLYKKSILQRSLDNLMLNYHGLHPMLRAVAILEPNGRNIRTGSVAYRDFRNILENTSGKPVSDLIRSDTGEPLVAIRHGINSSHDFGRTLGECVFVFNTSYLLGGIRSASLETESEFYIVDAVGTVLYPTRFAAVSLPLVDEYDLLSTAGYAPEVLRDGKRVIVSQRINDIDWRVISVTSTDVLLRDWQNLSYLLLAMAALTFMSLVGTSLLFYDRTAKALSNLVSGIDSIERGDARFVDSLDNTHEFQMLAKSFNRMLQKLYRLQQSDLDNQRRIFVRELENKQTQILFLQTQINPHFLYNTLECINSAGAVYGSWEVQQMAVSLGEILRYAVKGSNLVTLADEIQIVISYLSIQKVRFPDKVSLTLDIPEALEQIRMIKLILQPIVENCVTHGIEPVTKKCAIHIAASLRGNEVTVCVSDSGKGIDAQKLRRIREALAQNTDGFFNRAKSIGLANINHRIRLFYGEHYGVFIDAHPEGGTTVRVTFPADVPQGPRAFADEPDGGNTAGGANGAENANAAGGAGVPPAARLRGGQYEV